MPRAIVPCKTQHMQSEMCLNMIGACEDVPRFRRQIVLGRFASHFYYHLPHTLSPLVNNRYCWMSASRKKELMTIINASPCSVMLTLCSLRCNTIDQNCGHAINAINLYKVIGVCKEVACRAPSELIKNCIQIQTTEKAGDQWVYRQNASGFKMYQISY